MAEVMTYNRGQRIVGVERNRLATKLVQRYVNGASIRSLAADTGRSYGFIHRILSESEVEFRARGGARRQRQK